MLPESTATATDTSLASLLISFMDKLRRDIQSKMSDCSSLMHVKALDFIARTKEPSMRDVAEFLRITSPGATMIVDKLVENNEIDRRADADDRRLVRLVMTAKGRATLKAGQRIVTEEIKRMLSVLSKAEQQTLADILRKLA